MVVPVMGNDTENHVQHLPCRRKETGIDDEESASRAQHATDLGQRIPRSEEMVKNPGQRNGIEEIIVPRQQVICVCGKNSAETPRRDILSRATSKILGARSTPKRSFAPARARHSRRRPVAHPTSKIRCEGIIGDNSWTMV